MPEELMVIAITAIIAGSITIMSIAKAISRSVQAKSRPSDAGGPSLTKSELQVILRQAVEEATLPLQVQLEALERRLERIHPQLASGKRDTPLQLETPANAEPELAEAPRSERS